MIKTIIPKKKPDASKKALIIGTGAWGLAIAITIAEYVEEVLMVGVDKQQIDEINNSNTNNKYLPSVVLPNNIKAFLGIESDILNQKADNTYGYSYLVDLIVIATPSFAFPNAVEVIKKHISDDNMAAILIATKGICPDSGSFFTDAIRNDLSRDCAVLSGPNFAIEVAQKQPGLFGISSTDKQLGNFIAEFFGAGPKNTAIVDTDYITTQIASSIKNITAIACGFLDGNGYGDNAKIFVISMAIKEIIKISNAFGSKAINATENVIADLFLTCGSNKSRNFRYGKSIALGDIWDTNITVEGISAAKSIKQIVENKAISTPITNMVYNLITNPADVIADNLFKEFKKEYENFSS